MKLETKVPKNKLGFVVNHLGTLLYECAAQEQLSLEV